MFFESCRLRSIEIGLWRQTNVLYSFAFKRGVCVKNVYCIKAVYKALEDDVRIS